MRKPISAIVTVMVLCNPLPETLHAQMTGKEQACSSNLSEWSVVARGRMSRERDVRPLQIVRMDNNGEILYACLEAQTTDQLRSAGIEFRRSQLELLVDWGLLEYDGDVETYKTTIHVYGPEKIAEIRSRVRASVEHLAGVLSADLDSLKAYLRESGSEKSMFAVLYAYVLHAYAMDQFSEEIYREPQLSAGHPFWNGFAWALCPATNFPVGNIVFPVEDARFFAVRSNSIEGPGFQQYAELAKDVATDLKVDKQDLKNTFSSCDIFDESGRLTIPVFEGTWAAKLENMARRIYSETVALAESPEVQEFLGMSSQAQAAMFIHYEVRYAFLDHLLRSETIQTPIDFENGDRNGPDDIGSLVFLIR
jgi:hypothetical protein